MPVATRHIARRVRVRIRGDARVARFNPRSMMRGSGVSILVAGSCSNTLVHHTSRNFGSAVLSTFLEEAAFRCWGRGGTAPLAEGCAVPPLQDGPLQDGGVHRATPRPYSTDRPSPCTSCRHEFDHRIARLHLAAAASRRKARTKCLLTWRFRAEVRSAPRRALKRHVPCSRFNPTHRRCAPTLSQSSLSIFCSHRLGTHTHDASPPFPP